MSLVVDLSNFLVKQPEIKALVSAGKIGSDVHMPNGYVFTGKPYVKVEVLSYKAIIVITSYDQWSPPLRGNTLEFPQIEIDIWASPTRTDGNVHEANADDLIEEVYKALKSFVHLIHRSPSNGANFKWENTVIVSSEVIDGPSYSDVKDGNGARMARITVGVSK